MPSLLDRFRAAFKGAAPDSTSPQPSVQREAGVFSVTSTEGSAPPVSFDAIYYAIQKHDITNACFQNLMDETGKEGYDYISTDGKEAPDEKMVTLAENVLRGVKRDQNPRTKFQNTVMHTTAVGNDYWFIQRNKKGEAIGSVRVHPKTVTIYVDEYGLVKAYAQRVHGRSPKVFRPEDMIPFKGMANPLDDIYGMGKMEAVISTVIASDQKAQHLNQKLLDNGMNISGIIRLKDMGEADYQRVAAHIKDEFSGYRNAGRMLFAEGVDGIDKVGATFTDMQFLELLNHNIDRICAVLKVPKSLLGIHTKGALGADSAKADRLSLYAGAIRPAEVMIEETINNDLFPKCGITGIKFEFNVSSSTEYQQMTDATRADVEKGILTINEARYARGLEELDDAAFPFANKPLIFTPSGPLPLDALDAPPASIAGGASTPPASSMPPGDASPDAVTKAFALLERTLL